MSSLSLLICFFLFGHLRLRANLRRNIMLQGYTESLTCNPILVCDSSL